MNTYELIKSLLSLGYVDITFHNFQFNPYPKLSFFRALGGSRVQFHKITKDWDLVWLFSFREDNIYYWTANREWEPVEDGLSLESVILLYGNM